MAYQPVPQFNEDTVATDGDLGIPSLGVRRDADTSPVSADGDYHTMVFNQTGRLKTSMMPAAYDAFTGTITTASSVVGPFDVSRAGSVTVSIAGTYAGVNATFEVFDGVNWFGIAAQPLNSVSPGLTLTTGAQTNATLAWDISPLLGITQFRVRATAWTSGTANIRVLPGAAAVEYFQSVNGAVTVSGTVAATQSGTWTVQPGNTANTTPWLTRMQANAAGGATQYAFISAAAAASAFIKASSGTVYGVQLFNSGAAAAYFRFYNQTTAPTVGSGTPVKRLMIPAGGGLILPSADVGAAFTTGIAFTCTGGAADTDTTALAANQVMINVDYA